jgi:TolB-like protein/Tfp pilus assembly protein PilF
MPAQRIEAKKMSIADPVSRPDELSQERSRLIREHLKSILASHAFEGSKRAQSFLQLVVEHALAGRIDDLRERMIGAEMFGRPVDYDTANDAVVRVKATEVRKKLAQYYQELREVTPIRIELPPGSYVPKFHVDSVETPTVPDAEPAVQISAERAGSPEVSVLPEASEAKEHRWPSRGAWRSSTKVLLFAGAPIAIALIAVAGYLSFQWRYRVAKPEPEAHSIVVLPLKNLSGDPKQEYFADAMTEELIADLGQVASLRVISRTSAMTYKDTNKTLPEIARELGVDTVVEGSVLRADNQIRITAQLIDARTDHHLWANNYVRDLNHVLSLQGEVAQAIANEIRIEVTPEERARLARIRTVDPEAQELYLQGRQALNAGDPAKAIGFLQEAIDKYPDYAQAHAALANGYGWMGEAGWMPYTQAFPKQKSEAIKAIELDADLPDAHVELASAAMNLDWDWETQEKEFKRALALNPNSAPVRWAYANHLERLGRVAEAIEESKVALALDPVSSRAYMNSAFSYYFARQYDVALAQMQRASELPHTMIELTFPLGDIYAEKGLYDEAIQQFKKLGDAPHALGHMGNAYARAGNSAAARETLTKLQEHIRKDGVGRYEIALVYAGLGEKDEAFRWLEQAYQTRDKGLTYLKIDPCMDPLRSDPRFQDLERRVGLPTQS